MRRGGVERNVHRHAVGIPGQVRACWVIYVGIVYDERKYALWKRRGVWAICIEGADEERETNREADGDDQGTAGCAQAKDSRRHSSVGLSCFKVGEPSQEI